ncbi:antibiotic biosynthesis monooxygenase family protein [Bradyrhizobium sp. STM 3562]|uniref:antibiotic biosynthesis monooxygenase family protein n=1 Tax=Bradyrhizobium sp. STM 3562 TaxID=578924 RepID=UPI00388D3729
MKRHDVAKIEAGADAITLINIYEVDPERQAELARLLSEVTEAAIRNRPGFISVSVHSSFDGKHVVNYAQWASKADFENFMKAPGTQDQLKRFAALAKSVSPALYKVDAVHTVG